MDLTIQNDRKNMALHYAIRHGHTEIAELLIEKSTPEQLNIKGINGCTPLHLACKNNRRKIVKILLTKGVDLAIQDDKKNTALHLAVSRGYTEIAELLIEKSTPEQ